MKSGSSGDFSESTAASSSNGDGGSLSQKKIRPLSAPVLLPSEVVDHLMDCSHLSESSLEYHSYRLIENVVHIWFNSEIH